MTIKKKDDLLKRVNEAGCFWTEECCSYLRSLIDHRTEVISSNYDYDKRRAMLSLTTLYPDVARYNIYNQVNNIYSRMAVGNTHLTKLEDQNRVQLGISYRGACYPYC